MNNVSNYYIDNKNNLISDKDSYIVGDKYRFTILSPSLVRMEYSEDGVFTDNATSRVINRRFPKCEYSVSESSTLIQITTSVYTITYVKNSPFKAGALGGNLKVVINGTDKEWQINNPEVKNFRSINYSIDSIKDKIILDKGLYSLDGFCLLDDSTSLILDDNDMFVERKSKGKDLYLFLYNDDFSLCLRDYFTLTGYPSMIPRYALGAWWYKNEDYKTEDIINLVNDFENEKTALSVIMLGDYWHNNINKYLPDNSKIDLKYISAYLKEKNIMLGVTINPKLEITKGSEEYASISPYYNGDKLNFIPLSNEKLGIYLNMFINNLEQNGVKLFSIDYNNPQDRLGLWKFNHYHFGKSVLRNERGLVLSRNSSIASHRYPVIFSGKTLVNWTTLNLLPRYNLQAYNIGVSFIAHPIGGYTGGIEEEELYLRYIEFSCFSPIFMLASEGGKYYKRELWKWNPITRNTIIKYMNLRYKLIPYIYTESYYYHQTGEGLIKPFYYDYPKIVDEPIYNNQYFFGRNIFVSPITTRKNQVINRVMKRIFVPNGIWFELSSGKKFTGDKSYNNFYRDEDYPVFVKAGTILPLTSDTASIPATMELNIYPLDSGSYDLYEDDGITNNFKKGMYMITTFTYQYDADTYNFSIRRKDGRNLINRRSYILRFKNIKNITEVVIEDKSITYNCYYDGNDFVVNLYNLIVGRDFNISLKGTDTIVSSERLVSEEIKEILYDLPIKTTYKEKIDEILFSDLEIRKKRIKIRKLKRKGLDNKYIKIFINLLEYIEKA